jgi:hypothetical protein
MLVSAYTCHLHIIDRRVALMLFPSKAWGDVVDDSKCG